MACIDLRHLHILTSNPSLKGPLDNVLLGGQWIGNWCMDWACAGFSVTACTSWSCLPSSSSTFLARVDILAFISMSSESA